MNFSELCICYARAMLYCPPSNFRFVSFWNLDGGPPPLPMSPLAHEAFTKIETACQRDVEMLCEARAKPEVAAPPADPIIQWLMAPPQRMAAPPLIHPQALAPFDPINLGPLLDHFIETSLLMHRMEPSFFMVIETQSEEQEDQHAAPERALDSMISKLVEHSNHDKHQMQPEETDDITHHIRLKGQEILSQENVPEDRVRMARRLTEVTPEEMMKIKHHDHPWHHHPHIDDGKHHICPKKHQCLMEALGQNKLQPECESALMSLEKIKEHEMKRLAEDETFLAFFQIYFILFFGLLAMTVIRKFNAGKGLFLLRLRILQAVFSNPEIKAKVEDEVGGPLGNVPPLPSGALKMLSGSGRSDMRGKRLRFLQLATVMFALVAMDAFGLLPAWWPLIMMASCCGFLVVRIVGVFFSKPEVRECNCCCCGGSTLDVQNGTVSDAQACCVCCKGTGICAVKCSTCCTSGCCSCGDSGCDGSCGCCGGSNDKACKKEVVLDCCCCCCCDVSTLDVQNGTVSEAQACCTCCKGTGACAPNCKSCCTGGSCDCGDGCDGSCGCCGDDKKSKNPKLIVYQGIQIV